MAELPTGPRGLPLHPGSHLYKRWERQKSREEFEEAMKSKPSETLFWFTVFSIGILVVMIVQGCHITLEINPTETPGSPAAIER